MVNAQNILGFIRDIGFYHLIQFNLFTLLIDSNRITAIVLKPIVNT